MLMFEIFLFCQNLKNEGARVQKLGIFVHFQKRGKNKGFLRFRQNKKKLEHEPPQVFLESNIDLP